MHFRVLVPPGVKAGQTLRIRCPDGSMGDVKVPRGLKEGDTFIFEMNVPDEDAVKEAQKRAGQQGGTAGMDQSSVISHGRSGGGASGHGGSGGGGSRRRQQGGGGGGASVAGTAISAAATTSSITSQSCGFLDREIIDTRDFIAALGVGMLIGVSIVAGFLVGVLMATEPDEPGPEYLPPVKSF